MSKDAKKSAEKEAESFPRKGLVCESGPSFDEQGRSFAELITSPELVSYLIVGKMQPKHYADELDSPTLMATLKDHSAAVRRGELDRAEAMLMNQATALQATYVRLTELAMLQTQMPHIEGYMRLALRAQSQCRTTLETLAAIKNPPIVYARQANVTTGPQQINNGTGPVAHAPARKIEDTPNQLSGGSHELPTNHGAPGDASRADPALEALGEVDRAKNRRGKG